jgi:hypothetical protein
MIQGDDDEKKNAGPRHDRGRSLGRRAFVPCDLAATQGSAGAVYTMTNAASGNSVLVFEGAAKGRLRPPASSTPEVSARARAWAARGRSL